MNKSLLGSLLGSELGSLLGSELGSLLDSDEGSSAVSSTRKIQSIRPIEAGSKAGFKNAALYSLAIFSALLKYAASSVDMQG